MKTSGSFIREPHIALFLDVDGTLIEIASSPDAVSVPAALRHTLQAAASRENGALAFITGRAIASFDRLFAPQVYPVAGLHGLERRDSLGNIHRPSIPPQELDRARRVLIDLQAASPGLLLEDKGVGLAMHYRLALGREALVREVMTQLAGELGGRYMLRPGKCVWELAPAGYSKRLAIEAFMTEAPFARRTPVFVGDDLTDEDGFAAVNELGGYSIRVGNIEDSQARYQFDSVSAVIAWLSARAEAPP
jgi:trehalose 6-phosphate phosphatase